MPQPTSAALVSIKSLEGLEVEDLVVFRGRLCKVISFPKQNSSEDPFVQLEVLWGKADDTKEGWRHLSTLVADGALKLTIN